MAVLFLIFQVGCSSRSAPKETAGGYCPSSASQLINHAYFDSELLEELEKINTALGKLSLVKSEILISSSETPNAYIWKDGNKYKIAFTLGLIDLLKKNYDEYAFVIGHELAHIAQGHMKKEKAYKKKVQYASDAVGVVLEVVGIGLGIPFSGLISSITTDSGAHLVGLSYSREQEKDADRVGLNFMISAGYDPEGALSFHKKLSGLTDSSMTILSTHPSGEDRRKFLQEIIMHSPGYARRLSENYDLNEKLRN